MSYVHYEKDKHDQLQPVRVSDKGSVVKELGGPVVVDAIIMDAERIVDFEEW